MYYLLLIAILALSLICRGRVQRVFNRYAELPGQRGVTAAEAARQMLSDNGCNTALARVSGDLTDHFNPAKNTVGLSAAVYDSVSVAALAVAAHEIGHVCQHKEGYAPLSLRTSILPVAKAGSTAGPYIIIAGLLVQSTVIAKVGIYLYAAMLLFQIVTLPVEFNASRRGLAMLRQGGYVAESDMPAAQEVLRAAAMTYVLSALGTLASLLRYISMVQSSSKRKH